MKKIIILLMAVSIMLTSCGKSARLSNSDKKADKNTPPPAESAFKGNLPQITDDKNHIKQSLINFANEYKKAIGVFIVVAVIVVVGSLWIINKNKSHQTSKPLRANGQNDPLLDLPNKGIRSKPPEINVQDSYLLLRKDYKTIYLSYPDKQLRYIIKFNSFSEIEKQFAEAEIEKRKLAPLIIPDDIDYAYLVSYSCYSSDWLLSACNSNPTSLLPSIRKVMELILKVRKVIA